MTEIGLGYRITKRVGRLLWVVLVAYAVVVVTAFAALSEIALGRSLTESADLIESLLTLYADPEGEPTTVAPAMLADQLLGMGGRFVIIRAVSTDSGQRALYHLSPNMPAKEVQPPPGSSASVVREHVARVITDRGRWRFRVLHRPSGDFDIFVAQSRRPAVLAVSGLGVIALLLLPLAALVARRATDQAVTGALLPLVRVVAETKTIGPTDLTQRVEAETGVSEVSAIATEINRLIDRLERSYRALEEFTADASHELRTPLTHLRAQAHWALADDRSIADRREALSAIGKEVDQTAKMVDDLLLIARGENRQLPVARDLFDLGTVISDVEEVAEAMVAERDVDIQIDSPTPSWALGDSDRTRQILLNLVSNAVRHTEAGTIRLALERDDGMVGVAVSDTGCGIAEDQWDRIFDRFYRAERSRSRAHGGAGLGLTIARLLTELQGGHISMTSELDEGSTFTMWLPAASATDRET